MILEDATKEAFNYYPRDLTPQSNKKIVAVCFQCGRLKLTTMNYYCYLCQSCSQQLGEVKKGRVQTKEAKRKMHDNHTNNSGEKNSFFGKYHTEKTKARMSKNHANVKGINNPN